MVSGTNTDRPVTAQGGELIGYLQQFRYNPVLPPRPLQEGSSYGHMSNADFAVYDLYSGNILQARKNDMFCSGTEVFAFHRHSLIQISPLSHPAHLPSSRISGKSTTSRKA